MAAMAAQNSTEEREKLGVPSRNPLPLSASQEAQVRDIYYQNVRAQCADEIKGEFAVIPHPAEGRHRHSTIIRPYTLGVSIHQETDSHDHSY